MTAQFRFQLRESHQLHLTLRSVPNPFEVKPDHLIMVELLCEELVEVRHGAVFVRYSNLKRELPYVALGGLPRFPLLLPLPHRLNK